MKQIFESVIARGGFDLAALLNKIDTYHVEGKITDAEREDLYNKARADAKPQYDITKEIEALWAAIRELQSTNEPEIELEEEIIPPFVQPTGAHDAYQIGDKVIYNGKVYVCDLANCVWGPDILPSGWDVEE